MVMLCSTTARLPGLLGRENGGKDKVFLGGVDADVLGVAGRSAGCGQIVYRLLSSYDSLTTKLLA